METDKRSLIAQIEARPELTLEEIREIAETALFHAELRIKVPADATRIECYEYIRFADGEIEEYKKSTEHADWTLDVL